MSEEDRVQLQGKRSTSDDNKFLMASPMEMHGRRQILSNVEEITDANLLQVLNDALMIHSRNRSEEVYLEKYLRGIQPILDRYKKYNAEINNKAVVNIANQIVTFKTSEFVGEPITYVSRGGKKSIPKKVEKLNSMMISEGKQSKDMELAYKMFTAGVGYRLVLRDKAEAVSKGQLYDEAPFEIYITDPRNSFVVKRNDVTRRVLAGVTFVFIDELKNEVEFTVYTPNVTYKVRGTVLRAEKIVEKAIHNFGMVTLIEYPCNSVYMGAFEVVLPLLDAYNLTLSDRLDGIEQFIQAIMVFEGVDISKEQFDDMKELGALKVPASVDGRTGKVYYLNEQLDQSQTQTLVDDIYQTILEIVGMPSQGNAKTSDSSNNGAIIMKNGWWNAEARALETAGMWKEAETTFLKIVLKICEDANALNGLRVSDVEPKFMRRSYQDLLTKTQSFTTLISANVPPIQAYKYSGLDSDPEAASIQYDEYQKERAQNLDEMMGLQTDVQVPSGGRGGREENNDDREDDDERGEENEEERRKRRRRLRRKKEADGDGIIDEK